jgi:hypothetical protein
MRPVRLLGQPIQRVQNLAHECAPAGHNRAHKDHLSREALELAFLDGLPPFNMLHLEQNVLDPLAVDTDGHVDSVDDETQNLHDLRGQKGLSLGDWDAEVGANLQPQLHLFQCLFVRVATSKEVVNVRLKRTKECSTPPYGHILNRLPHEIHKVVGREPMTEGESSVDKQGTVDMKREKRPVSLAHWHIPKGFVNIPLPDERVLLQLSRKVESGWQREIRRLGK